MNLDRAREIARAALRNLEANQQRIDDLNVYPVPDGDTGTNLTLTVRAIVEALEKSNADGHEAVARELSRAALMGARGNSGVIFSQIVRGFADVLGERDLIDEPMVARAFRSASDAAYRAVRRPVEGTMLTVIREMAEAAESSEARNLDRAELLSLVVARGEDSLARTPELLVDPQGSRGRRRRWRRAPRDHQRAFARPSRASQCRRRPRRRAPPPSKRSTRSSPSSATAPSSWSREQALDADELESELERLGDSLLVVGDSTALKVHVHTDDPGAALRLGTASGTIDGVEIANMHRQTLEREERLSAGTLEGLPTLETGVVVVAPGEGNRRLFESLRATRVIEGGQTMNPSTEEIVAAVDATPATEVIVLPNNKNVILSAEQAVGAREQAGAGRADAIRAGGAGRDDRLRPGADAAENERGDGEAIEGVATGEITIASRDVTLDGIDVRKGAWLGLADGAAVASGESFDAVAGAVAERLLDGGRELLTLLTGADEPAARCARRRDRRPPPGGRDRDPRRRPAALSAAPLGGVTMAIRVLLVEDNEVYRSTLELLLDGRDGHRDRRRPSPTGADAAAAAERLDPDVVLMDFRLPGLDGAQATAAVRASAAAAAVLCLTAEATDDDRQAVLAAGAVGLVEKGRPIEELVQAIHVRDHERGSGEPVNLTAENTAIVLDSTSDFPDARNGSRTCASCRSTSTSAPRASKTTSTSARTTSTSACGSADAPDDLAADAAGLRGRVRGASRLRADLRAPALGEALRHVPVRRRPRPRTSVATGSASSTPRPRRSQSACSRSRSSAASRGERPTRRSGS